MSSAYTIGVVSFAWPWCIDCWLWTGDCSDYLFPGYLFPALFANQILICLKSAAHVSPVLSPLHLQCVGWLWTGHCSGFIVSGTVCSLDIDLFNDSSTCTLELSFSIILVQWLILWKSNRFNTFIFHLGTVYLHHFR